MVLFPSPRQYVVKKKGAVLRQAVLIASEEICILEGGTTVLCDRSESLVEDDSEKVRMHVYEPLDGWLTLKCLKGEGLPHRDASHTCYARLESAAAVAGVVRPLGAAWWIAAARR